MATRVKCVHPKDSRGTLAKFQPPLRFPEEHELAARIEKNHQEVVMSSQLELQQLVDKLVLTTERKSLQTMFWCFQAQVSNICWLQLLKCKVLVMCLSLSFIIVPLGFELLVGQKKSEVFALTPRDYLILLGFHIWRLSDDILIFLNILLCLWLKTPRRLFFAKSTQRDSNEK